MADDLSEELEDVLKAAQMKLYAGQITDTAALDEAVKRDLVRREYAGAGGLLGLATLRLTPRGELALTDGVIYGR